jgi:hypothetical protein
VAGYLYFEVVCPTNGRYLVPMDGSVRSCLDYSRDPGYSVQIGPSGQEWKC